MRGLYIHIPFCASKCSYCSFASYPGASKLIAPYLKALSSEAALYSAKFKPQTLYIGGGTPSFLTPAQIKSLCAIVERNFGPIKNFKEAAFECNPESLTPAKAKLLKSYGFTRLSIGMQTTSDKHLKLISRPHTHKDFLKAYKTARKYFNNINVDLIAALPGQTLADFKSSLHATAALKPEHISIYGLEIEEGTKIHSSGFRGDDILCRQMLEYTAAFLAGQGFVQYEISNYSQKGKESKHNINYWQNGSYLGLGSAAASYINGVRRVNTPGIKEYIKALSAGTSPVISSERLQGKAKAGEAVILGLRMMAGINLKPGVLKMFKSSLTRLKEQGLIAQAKNNIRLTEEGKYLANEAFRHFVEPFDED